MSASAASGSATSSSSNPPFGWVDGALNAINGTSTVGQYASVSVSGWAADEQQGAPVSQVQVFIDGKLIGNATLGFSRPDVAQAYDNPNYTNSGWGLTYNIGNLAVGTHTVTAVAYDSQGLTAQLQGSPVFTVSSNTPPFGWLEAALNASNGSSTIAQYATLHVSGWAADQEDGAPVADVKVFLDGSPIGDAQLGISRPDVAKAFNNPRYTNSGWVLNYNIGNLPIGQHTVTAVAYDSQGAATQLTNNANSFSVTSNTPPFGWVDSARGANGTTLAQNSVLVVSGWAADQEDGSPVSQVQVLIDGNVVGNAALGLARPDVASALNNPRYANSGWSFNYNIGNMAGGSHSVTAIAYDSQFASAQLQGKRTFAVTGSAIPTAIDHVIFMLQENRTFDNYFGMLNPYRKANGWNIGDDGNEYDVDGLDGSKANISNPMDENTNPNDTTTTFTPFKLATTCTDDMSSAWLESYGDVSRYNFTTSRAMQQMMNGFVHNAENEAKDDHFGDTRGKRAMGFFDQGFLNYYYFMASQFAVSDRWFSPVASKTIPNRLAVMTGGTTQGLVYDPSLDDKLPQLSIETIFQELDNAGVSWKIYYTDTDVNDPFPATTFGYFTYSDNYMYSPGSSGCQPPTTNVNGACIDTSHIAPLSQYFTDVQNGTLPQFAYIEPGYNDNTDEHPGANADITVGQRQVSNIINALMNSQSWSNSVFFLSYDEGGGPFDHVPPVPGQSNLNTDSSLANITPDISSIAVNPDGFNPCPSPIVSGQEQPSTHCDLRNHGTYQDPGYNSGDAAAQQGFAAQLGFRLPNMVISPFTRRHYVSHIPMDHTAIIKFVENRFIGSSAHLTNRDATQPNLLDFFDFNAVPWATPPSPPTPASGSCNPENF